MIYTNNINPQVTLPGGFFVPNVLISDIRGNSGDEIAGILRREEVNLIKLEGSEQEIVRKTAAMNAHMLMIRDGGYKNNSFGIVEGLRNYSDIPVIVISDSCDEMYRIMSLSKGADICLGSDFGSFELKAHMLALLRRYAGSSADSFTGCASASSGDVITNGVITVDRRSREVYSGTEHIKLTAIEYGIVEYLMEQCGKVCPVEDIYRSVWRESPYSVKKTVVEHIRRIRCKLEPDPHNPRYIKAVFGIGYKMEKLA